MKKLMIVLMVMAIVSIAAAINFSPSKIPFPYDQNQIVGRKLGGVQIEATEYMIVDVKSSHSKGFPFVITIVSAPPGVYLVNNADSWKLQWTTDVNDVGTYYIVLEVTDAPPPPWRSKTRQGTIVIQIVELNPGPVLHELEDTIIADASLKRQQKRWQELKKQRTVMVGPVRVPLEWEVSG